MNKGLQQKKSLFESLGTAGIIAFIIAQAVFILIIGSDFFGLPSHVVSAIQMPVKILLFITIVIFAVFKIKSRNSKNNSGSTVE